VRGALGDQLDSVVQLALVRRGFERGFAAHSYLLVLALGACG
jgi:hypothetical protein